MEDLRQGCGGWKGLENRRLATKEAAAAWVRKADQRDTKADAVVVRRNGRLDLTLA